MNIIIFKNEFSIFEQINFKLILNNKLKSFLYDS
jgi:hypothetical protein